MQTDPILPLEYNGENQPFSNRKSVISPSEKKVQEEVISFFKRPIPHTNMETDYSLIKQEKQYPKEYSPLETDPKEKYSRKFTLVKEHQRPFYGRLKTDKTWFNSKPHSFTPEEKMTYKNIFNLREYSLTIDENRTREKLDQELEHIKTFSSKECDKYSFDFSQIASEEKSEEEWGFAPEFGTVDGSGAAISEGNLRLSQGQASYQEDRYVSTIFSLYVGGREEKIKMTGVFDGHGGSNCSEFAKTHMEIYLKKWLEKFNPVILTESGIRNALKIAFVDLSRAYTEKCLIEQMREFLMAETKNPLQAEEFLQKQEGIYSSAQVEKFLRAQVEDTAKVEEFLKNLKPPQDGSTANISLIINNELWVANTGDSRAILINAEDGSAQVLSEDARVRERFKDQMIQNRGGEVFRGRSDGILAITRSLGDPCVPGISSRPKVVKIAKSPEDWKNHYVIQYSDGISDAASYRQIASLAEARIKKGDSLAAVAKKIVKTAYNSSRDNLSLVVSRP